MIAVVILTFIAVFLIVCALFFAVTAAKESSAAVLKRRLRRMAGSSSDLLSMPDDLRTEIIKETPPLDRLFSRIPALQNVERLLDHAGLKITLTNFLLYSFVATVVIFAVVYILSRRYLLATGFSVVTIVGIFLFLYYKKNQRLDKFTEQLPEALNMMSRSLRAGHSLTSAVELVGDEIAEPAKELFKTAYEQQKLGLRITDALINMVDRIDCVDLRFFTTAVSINSEVGGNLAEILDKLADTIRERLKIKRQVRVFTAQGRMSGYVLGALPIVTFLIFNMIMPGYEDVLIKEREGQYILGYAIISQLLGFLFIRKIINIRI
ncbi:type II secretion system F family protein [Geobacter hydrogenophilus]|uniref:Secretion protein n=1 Tax=Geobacter hydrogenophilus TaxID=40983 RepID=A0A9W6G1W7_9BACT|nr:type II secretion system F family protein [Geobacter hydrogenophilus]MBT0893233.1 type II secretion system F family protein [Geobacter hydrogenophilus]GLI38920.1 secretion protein [Geobacter hydrogenophilus]